MARKNNTEKASTQYLQETARLVLGEALAKVRTRIRNDKIKDKELVEIVSKLLPVLTNEETQTPTDVTMEVLAKKALTVSLRVQQAAEDNLKEEAIEMPGATAEEDALPADEEQEEDDEF